MPPKLRQQSTREKIYLANTQAKEAVAKTRQAAGKQVQKASRRCCPNGIPIITPCYEGVTGFFSNFSLQWRRRRTYKFAMCVLKFVLKCVCWSLCLKCVCWSLYLECVCRICTWNACWNCVKIFVFQEQFQHTHSKCNYNTHISSTITTHTFQVQFHYTHFKYKLQQKHRQ